MVIYTNARKSGGINFDERAKNRGFYQPFTGANALKGAISQQINSTQPTKIRIVECTISNFITDGRGFKLVWFYDCRRRTSTIFLRVRDELRRSVFHNAWSAHTYSQFNCEQINLAFNFKLQNTYTYIHVFIIRITSSTKSSSEIAKRWRNVDAPSGNINCKCVER